MRFGHMANVRDHMANGLLLTHVELRHAHGAAWV